MDEIFKIIDKEEQNLIKLRREFHQIPETGFQEFKTSDKIIQFLKRIGVDDIQPVAGTGVIGVLKGRSDQKTILYRADIDGLPIEEENDVTYRSQHPGKMHACGHDAHIAMALVTCSMLSRFKDKLNGNVKFVFQPAEETVDGAKKVIEAGALENPKVDAAIGFHVWNNLQIGKISIQQGPIMAASNHLNINIMGKEAHGAKPHEGIDPILAAAQLIQQLHSIVHRKISIDDKFVISIGKISGGTARNIIAKQVDLQGIIRTFDSATRSRIEREIKNTGHGLEKSHGVKVNIDNMETVPALVNDEKMVNYAKKSAQKFIDPENIVAIEKQFGSEDVALFFQKVPGCYIILGSGNTATGLNQPHHNSKFDIDERCLITGVKIAVDMILSFLTQKND